MNAKTTATSVRGHRYLGFMQAEMAAEVAALAGQKVRVILDDRSRFTGTLVTVTLDAEGLGRSIILSDDEGGSDILCFNARRVTVTA